MFSPIPISGKGETVVKTGPTRKFILPAGVSCKASPDGRVFTLNGCYYYGGQTEDVLVLQPYPHRHHLVFNWWSYFFAFLCGISVGASLMRFFQ